MNERYQHILSPVRVAGNLLRNRVITGPLTIHTSSNGEPYPTEKALRFFEARAKAGAGLVTCASIPIGGGTGGEGSCAWDVKSRHHVYRLAEMAERIHFHGAKCTMEIMGLFPDNYAVCDGVSIMGGPGVGRFMPKEKMAQFKEDCVNTARVLVSAGFDGILLHAGHNIPLAQFLSPLSNTRTDEYGGTTENRCRYVREILAEIRAAIGPGKIIDLRLSGTECEAGGIDIDEGLRIAEILQEHVDILQISAGMHTPEWRTVVHPCAFLPPMPNVYLAEIYKKSGRFQRRPDGAPFISTIGSIRSLDDAESILAAGKADFVVMVRPFIADPDVLRKGLDGKSADIRPCIRCMRCHDSDNYGFHLQCSVNPAVGMEQVLERIPSSSPLPKKVAVVGGGPAGMQASLTAASRGHRVTLFEAAPALGGKLAFTDHVPFKYTLKAWRDYMVGQIAKSGVTVKLNTTARVEDLAGFDAVIAALGSSPLVPPIAGIENARLAVDVFGKEDTLGGSIVVIGGGQVGCEAAIHFARLGKTVTIVEMRPALAPDASPTARDELLVEVARTPGLTVLLGAACTKVEPNSVTYRKDGALAALAADTVILAAGMKARSAEADALIGTAAYYAPAGDCVKPRTVEWAVKEGFYAAMRV